MCIECLRDTACAMLNKHSVRNWTSRKYLHRTQHWVIIPFYTTGATGRHTNRGVNRCLIAFQASIYFDVIQYASMILKVNDLNQCTLIHFDTLRPASTHFWLGLNTELGSEWKLTVEHANNVEHDLKVEVGLNNLGSTTARPRCSDSDNGFDDDTSRRAHLIQEMQWYSPCGWVGQAVPLDKWELAASICPMWRLKINKWSK